MLEKACFCDLCVGDGVVRLAEARYWNNEGEEYHCCAEHLKDVQTIGLEYEELDGPGDVNL